MKREEKNALSRQKILEAAMTEFSVNGYTGASLNTICSDNGISKGIVYHYYKDKDELFISCVKECYDTLTSYLKEAVKPVSQDALKSLDDYFDARLQYFAGHPQHLGIFLHTLIPMSGHIAEEVAAAKEEFNAFNISVLTDILNGLSLRENFSSADTAEDFKDYMDYFNARFRSILVSSESPEQALKEHEEQCHRQLDILLNGVVKK
ncbi:MAG: TetR/AcrR family transcriptional regulator [Oscillospiraceae bacterium]